MIDYEKLVEWYTIIINTNVFGLFTLADLIIFVIALTIALTIFRILTR